MIAIIGASGHAKCVYECFYLQGMDVIGFFDDDEGKHGQELINGLRVLGAPDDLVQYSQVDAVFVAIGDNRTRMEKFSYYKRKGFYLPNAVHREVYCSPFAEMGEGNFVMGRAVLNPCSRVGNYCIINTSATVGHDCLLEDGAQIGPGVNLAGGSVLKEGAFIGIGGKVGPKAVVGSWAVVGAGAVVLDDLPDQAFCSGTPAKPVRNIDKQA